MVRYLVSHIILLWQVRFRFKSVWFPPYFVDNLLLLVPSEWGRQQGTRSFSYLPLTCHLTAQTDDWWVQQWQQKPLASRDAEDRSVAGCSSAVLCYAMVWTILLLYLDSGPRSAAVLSWAASGLWPCARYCLVFGAITHPSCFRLSSSLVPKPIAHCFKNLESLFDIETRRTRLNYSREYS